MDKNQLARHLLKTNIDKNGSIKKLNDASAKEIHEVFEKSDIIINNPAELENLISSIDGLDLSLPEKLALKNLFIKNSI